MPVLHFPLERLQRALGKEIDQETLRERLPLFGVPVEESEGPEWSVEVFPDRPDLLSAELLGRALRAFLDLEPGLPAYEVAEPNQTLVVEESVLPVRPAIVCGAAHGLSIDEGALKALMDLQEDLHWGLGARRQKVSIGIHDARDLTAPYTYEAVDPDEVSFVPLHGADEMTMRAMLTELEKGRDYAHLVEGHDRWPLITDDTGEVLSFPPIINGTTTTLREGTTDVFVDVTGTDGRACRQVLNIVMTHLAEMGGSLEAVRVQHPDGETVTPDLSPTTHTLDPDHTRELLGLGELSDEDLVRALARMGHEATVEGQRLAVRVGAWRSDVLHPVDLAEDVAIGTGYDRFHGTPPRSVTYGQHMPRERFDNRVRQALAGLGYLECMTLTLTSEAEQTERFGAGEPLMAVRNPESSEQAVGRRRLLPGLMTLAGDNTHRDLPQRLFEVGDVLLPEGDQRPVNRRRVAALEVASDANFTRTKSHVEALMRALGIPFQERAASAPGFAKGRCAVLEHGEDGRVLGHFGELDPAAIMAFEIANPCAGFELELLPTQQRRTWSPGEEPLGGLELRGA